MVDDVQPEVLDPPDELLRVAREVTSGWLTRVLTGAAAAGGAASFADELDGVAADASELLLDRLAGLLATDVDEQRANPLQVYRDAVVGPTAWLRNVGAAAPPAEPGAVPTVANDPYRLGPATWSDVDPAMHEAGIMWGAWKAATVLQRRRTEGQR